jgi:heme oxygenase
MSLRRSEDTAFEVSRARSCIETLRHGTLALHTQLDGLLTVSGAFDRIHGYRHYLMMMQRFCAEHAWLHRDEDPELSSFFDSTLLLLIECDLQQLDLQQPALEQRDVAASSLVCPPKSSTNEPAIAWGRAYVLLGSHLGAKEILARLSQSRISDPPVRFLNGCRQSAQRWRAYMDALDARPWTPRQKASMLESAQCGFHRALAIGHDIFAGEPRT